MEEQFSPNYLCFQAAYFLELILVPITQIKEEITTGSRLDCCKKVIEHVYAIYVLQNKWSNNHFTHRTITKR